MVEARSLAVMAAKTDISKDLSFLDGKRGEMTATLREWCAINTGSRNHEGLAAMRGGLAEAFAEPDMGVLVVRQAADHQHAAVGPEVMQLLLDGGLFEILPAQAGDQCAETAIFRQWPDLIPQRPSPELRR